MQAFALVPQVILPVTIESAGQLEISGISSRDTTVSSEQVLVLETTYKLAGNLVESVGLIQLPPGFGIAGSVQTIPQDTTLRWVITAPANLLNPATFQIRFSSFGD